jgi:hypothetical protein
VGVVETNRTEPPALGGPADVEVAFVIPCLNEREAIVGVVEEARRVLADLGVSGEVLVVDNASDDDSAERAAAAGARVVLEEQRGYGSAYLAGFAAARGRYLVLTDADGSYDLSRVGDMLSRLRSGADMVLGTRMKGEIQRGAMPWAHRWIGNPLLTGMLNLLFRAGVSDAHCGLRAVRRDALAPLQLSATGMEFASEMVLKAAKRGLRVEEVPIAYRPRIGESKLNSVRDAWRHIRFMLVHSPSALFLAPGLAAMLGGLGLLVPFAVDHELGDRSWSVPLAIVGAFLAVTGANAIQLGLFARTYATVYLGEENPLLEHAWRRFKLEHGLAIAAVTLLGGLVLTVFAHFNSVPDTHRGLLGLTLVALGVQGIFAAFFLSILGLSEHAILRRRGSRAADRSVAHVDDPAVRP